MLYHQNREIPTDPEGYLEDIADWQPEIAEQIAQKEGVQLTKAHWEVLNLLREFYQEYQLSPAMRPLIKYMGLKLNQDKARSIYLMQLFGESPAKTASKLAGLPKPTNCL